MSFTSSALDAAPVSAVLFDRSDAPAMDFLSALEPDLEREDAARRSLRAIRCREFEPRCGAE